MHNLWEEMLPFYIAGSLPKAEATRLERHLEHCETCSQSMNDWKLVAAAVRAEAASQMRALPPLSAEVLREASRRIRSRVYETADVPRLVEDPRQRPPARTSAPVVALVAAFTVLVIGGVLALMVMTATQQNPNANGVALLPSATMTETPLPVTDVSTEISPTEAEATAIATNVPRIIVIEPSETPVPPTVVLPTLVPPTSEPPPTQVPIQDPPTQMVPAQRFPTFLPPPTATPFVEQSLEMSLGMGGGGGADCTAQALIPAGSVINLYARPRTDATVLATISSADVLTALAVSDNGWYQVMSAQGNVGWVQQSLVSASGNCDSLPLIPADTATNVDTTPTDTALPFPPLEPTTEGTTTSENVPTGESAEVM